MATQDVENGLPEARRYVQYAQAYLQASLAACCRMVDHVENDSWPNASVVLLLAAHSLELFLKGALLAKGVDSWSHDLERLHADYHTAYSDASFQISNPFQVHYMGFTESEISAIKSAAGIPSIRYRYPVKRPGIEWGSASEMCPNEFLCVLDDLNERFDTVSGMLWEI